MPQGTIQLIYAGEQNLYLTQSPQITYFKGLWKRHTNFSMNTIHEFFDNKVAFGNQIRCKLGKNGDLLGKMGIYIKLSGLNNNKNQIMHSTPNCPCTCSKCLLGATDEKITYGWVNSIGHVLLERIDIQIGGQIIDRHYGEWLEIWTELTQTAEKRLGYYEMIGKKDPMAYTVDSFTDKMDLYVPFNFWFCRNIGSALPVMSLIYHDVEIIIKIRDFDKCWVCNKPDVPRPKAHIDACILADYIYLSLEERRNFYTESHFYLIEQLQVSDNNNSVTNMGRLNIDLNFNHPVKELIWLVQRTDILGPSNGTWPNDCSYPIGNDHFNFTTSRIPRLSKSQETFACAQIQFSGVDRTAVWPASYFRLWQNYYYHTRIPTASNLYTYSFSLSPEDVQPAGNCDMGMIDGAKLCLKLLSKHVISETYPITCRIYAINYQILFITGGMAATIY